MSHSARPHKTASIPDSIFARLNEYALAAAAAGVGALALAPPADAKIIYIPTHKHVSLGHGVLLTLNRERIVNFRISVVHTLTENTNYVQSFAVTGLRQGNSVAGYYGYDSDSNNVASALRAGQQIGTNLFFVSKGPFPRVGMASATSRGQCLRPWANAKKRYLGLKFRVKNGPTQYGWARLTVTCGPQNGVISGVLSGYAWETTPNKPIIAGKTKGPGVITIDADNLGRLALGSAGR